MAKLSVIVVGAGAGTRFGGDENKIFAHVDGQPCFLKSLQLFVNRDDVVETLLVVSPGDLPQMKTKFSANLGFMGVKLVEGGAERRHSVAAGLAALGDSSDYVAIHDAVRPCVAAEWITAIVDEAVKSGAAIPATPVTATLKRVSAARIVEETVPRAGLWAAQTPQVFRRDLILAAYKALPADAAPTDDAAVVERSGHAVTIVEGDPRNIKITTKGDLSLAGPILKTLPQPKRGGPMGAFEEAKW